MVYFYSRSFLFFRLPLDHFPPGKESISGLAHLCVPSTWLCKCSVTISQKQVLRETSEECTTSLSSEEKKKTHLFLIRCAHSSLTGHPCHSCRGSVRSTPGTWFCNSSISFMVSSRSWLCLCCAHDPLRQVLTDSVLDANGMQRCTQPRWEAQGNCGPVGQSSCVTFGQVSGWEPLEIWSLAVDVQPISVAGPCFSRSQFLYL